MNRSHVLRIVGIVAVLMAAVLMTGCLKTVPTMSFDPVKPTIKGSDKTLIGKLILSWTGGFSVGNYDKLTVQFTDDANPANNIGAPIVVTGLKLVVHPFAKSAELNLANLATIVVPAAAFDDGGALKTTTKAKFTLTGTGLLLDPISATAEVVLEPPV